MWTDKHNYNQDQTRKVINEIPCLVANSNEVGGCHDLRITNQSSSLLQQLISLRMAEMVLQEKSFDIPLLIALFELCLFDQQYCQR